MIFLDGWGYSSYLGQPVNQTLFQKQQMVDVDWFQLLVSFDSFQPTPFCFSAFFLLQLFLFLFFSLSSFFLLVWFFLLPVFRLHIKSLHYTQYNNTLCITIQEGKREAVMMDLLLSSSSVVVVVGSTKRVNELYCEYQTSEWMSEWESQFHLYRKRECWFTQGLIQIQFC